MHLTTLFTLCIALVFMTHTCILAIDHAERGLEKPPEPAPVEAGEHEQDQGKPRCIYPSSLNLFYSSSVFIYVSWMCIR
jgi:hypothetical protein